MKDIYSSPFTDRYATKEMIELFSPDVRYSLWRKLWLSLAKAEKTLGLNITDAQIKEMEEHLYDIDYDVVKAREEIVKHDVMAHLYAYGLKAPKAKGIMHLGATSCYVTDNSDLVIYKKGLLYIKEQLTKVIKTLSDFAIRYKDTPTLSYTHFQPAQFTNIGKRATLWLSNFVSDLENLDYVINNLKFLGCRGTTGTEASFLELFNGDGEKIDKLNELIAKDFGFDSLYDVVGQTYPRKVDSMILNALSNIAESSYKFATDIRLLEHEREIEEPFSTDQVGSSAMAYKRNPVNSEKVCSLSRYLITDSYNAKLTASNQWLERSLDDSANRRISMPEGFLCASAILSTLEYIISGLSVNINVVNENLKKELPYIATENLLMEAVKRGGDRQKLHELIRKTSMDVTQSVKNGNENDLVEKLVAMKEFSFAKDKIEELLDPKNYTGRSSIQVMKYIEKINKLF